MTSDFKTQNYAHTSTHTRALTRGVSRAEREKPLRTQAEKHVSARAPDGTRARGSVHARARVHTRACMCEHLHAGARTRTRGKGISNP